MPYLNWKEAQVGKSVTEVSRLKSELKLSMAESEREKLAQVLSEVFAQGGTELRVDLPDSWILFFKPRDGGSRLLIAHPEKEEWVSTLALEPEHGLRVASELQSAHQGKSIRVGSLGAVDRISNVEIVIEAL